VVLQTSLLIVAALMGGLDMEGLK